MKEMKKRRDRNNMATPAPERHQGNEKKRETEGERVSEILIEVHKKVIL